jgi:hypothetical protein
MLGFAVVESVALPCDGTGFRSPKGRLGIWTPAPDLLILRMTDQGDKAFAGPIIHAFDEISKRSRQHRLFFDLETMTTYDSELRTRLTARFYEDRLNIAAFHVLVGSKLTAMGVSVANLALGGIITSHSSRVPFVLALDAAIAASKAVGFESSVVFAG